MADAPQKKGITVRDVHAAKFIDAYAQHLMKSGKVVLPVWVDIAKDGVLREHAPYNPNWYFVRLASVARSVYLRAAGVDSLRRKYGGKLRRGSRPERKGLSSEAIARSCLQQLEKLGVVAKSAKVNGKRVITKQGQADLDRIAGAVSASQ